MRIARTPLMTSALLAATIALAPAPAFAATTDAVGVHSDVVSVASPVSATVAEQAEPDSEAEAGRLAFVLVPLLGAAVVVIGAIVVISRGRRGRRGD